MLFPQCQFCKNAASTSLDIFCSDRGEPVIRNYLLCDWHEKFYKWMYKTLGDSVKARMQIHEVKEGKEYVRSNYD